MNCLFANFLDRFIQDGQLEIITSSGHRRLFGDGKRPHVLIRLADRSAQMQLLFNAPLRLGELYMDGRFVILQGTIYDLLLTVTRNLASQSSTRLQKLLSHARTALGPLHQRNNKNRAKRNAAHHYDLDGRLYDLLLDSDRQYSCAYFEHPGQTLGDAQLAKKRHIAAKLLVKPGDSGLALYMAKYCGADVTSVTLSEE